MSQLPLTSALTNANSTFDLASTTIWHRPLQVDALFHGAPWVPCAPSHARAGGHSVQPEAHAELGIPVLGAVRARHCVHTITCSTPYVRWTISNKAVPSWLQILSPLRTQSSTVVHEVDCFCTISAARLAVSAHRAARIEATRVVGHVPGSCRVHTRAVAPGAGPSSAQACSHAVTKKRMRIE